MSQISSLFNRCVRFEEERQSIAEQHKEDAKTLNQEKKELGLSGSRKKAFDTVVKEKAMTDEKRAKKRELENEILLIKEELNLEE